MTKSSLATAYALKKRSMRMAEGGTVTPHYAADTEAARERLELSGDRSPSPAPQTQDHSEMPSPEALGSILGRVKGRKQFAEGGDVPSHTLDGYQSEGEDGSEEDVLSEAPSTEETDSDDMVARIMKKRQMFSEGGQVANADHGIDDSELAGFSPNEFDDLTLRDDLESSYTGENSGDELGNERTDADQEDDVARIMKARKAQRNPSPA